MTVGPRASTERKEDQREVRGKMTLTVEYSEMTAKIVEHFKITATTSANWGIPARTQEEYKQKKHFSPRPHAHSHAFWHIRTLTHMTVSTHAYLYSSHTSWRKKKKRKTQKKEKNPGHALRLEKKKINVNKLLPKKSERGTSEAESQGQWRQPLLHILGARAATITTGSFNLTIDTLA